MNCPYCNKQINAMTGFQEVVKFKNHLIKCKKYSDRKEVPNNDFGDRKINITCVSLSNALEIRANSNQ